MSGSTYRKQKDSGQPKTKRDVGIGREEGNERPIRIDLMTGVHFFFLWAFKTNDKVPIDRVKAWLENLDLFIGKKLCKILNQIKHYFPL